MTLHDKFGRQITDLRISITDRCNFRCVYCRSADRKTTAITTKFSPGPSSTSRQDLPQPRIRKIRITGGEPLVREGVEDYIARLHALGVEDLSMTTTATCCRTVRPAPGRRPPPHQHQPRFARSERFERITRTKSFSNRDAQHRCRPEITAGGPPK